MDELIERAKSGDAAAMETLLGELAPRVQRFGATLCGNVHDAEDVLQDTLLGIARHLPEFEGRSSLSSWVFALARSACARRRRGLKNAPSVPTELLSQNRDDAPTPEMRVADRELLLALSAALAALSEEAREVILLRDVEGLSATEAADVLGITAKALKSRLHRARTALRERLRPVLEHDAPRPSGDCPDVMLLWSRKLEGELDQLDCAQMEAHLATCGACAAACSALKRALDTCRRTGATEVPPEVQASVKAAVRTWVQERR
jgi:RNA polymerase sigma-70 factor (ECF subfamily)